MRQLKGEAWLLANYEGRYEIQRIDETCADTYTDADALELCILCAATGDADAMLALRTVNFQEVQS